MTTEQRLERLERENRWMRRIGVVGLALVVVSLAGFVHLLGRNGVGQFDAGWELWNKVRGRKNVIAEMQCWSLHGKAMMWTLIKLKSLSSLDEMVAPLRADDDENWLESVPVDPWGNPYVLEISTEGLRVRSFGADGRKDTADDIMNRTR
ncbi:MAG: type II secretion system protein GspG [Planctomycetota bacterium]|jgi:hypothetical protein